MKLLLLGATGRTGRLVLQDALRRQYRVKGSYLPTDVDTEPGAVEVLHERAPGRNNSADGH